MTEAAVNTRYWCHGCEKVIEEAMVGEDIKCPFCGGGFIEEMAGEDSEGLQLEREWGTPPGDSEDDDDDDIAHEFEGFIRRHGRASALRRVLDSIQDDLRADRERDNSVLINAFNQALASQGSALLDADEARDGRGGSSNSNDDGLLEEYDVLGAGLSLLLQHLAENDPNRYGTPPAKREAVEALPTVQIAEAVSCSVCLDDLELGSPAKQMPCGHRFHSSCILPWLELHSSCPVCRFELPSEETKDLNEPSDVHRRTESARENDSESGNSAWPLVPWFFSGLFSVPEPSHTDRGTLTTDQQSPSTNPNAGGN